MLSANGSSKLPRRGNGPTTPQGSTSSLYGRGEAEQAAAAPASPSAQDGGNTRERVRKRDALIRAKAGKDMKGGKKGAGAAAAPNAPYFVAGRKAKPGSVLFMRPNAPLTVSEGNSILQVAQTMAANRADAVLVTSGDASSGQQQLKGILTDKDLAFRVVAQNLDIRATKAATVMTPNPSCVDPDSPAQEALQKMVDGHFRHLPVTDDDSIYGILDITKCFYQALSKIETAHAKSQALFDALQGVDDELSAHMGPNPEKLAGFFNSLKDKMASPDLATVLQREGPPPEVSARTSVRDAVLLMKETKSTAVLVMDPHEHALAGIFTSKDVVLRVLAQGLDPATTSIVRVMTPRPDTASEEMTVKDALRKMHDGHYLHLPVVSAISPTSPVGLVNVLQLTYFALEQMQQLSSGSAGAARDANASPVQSEGPLWNKFWNSTFETGSANGGDTESKANTAGAAHGNGGNLSPGSHAREDASSAAGDDHGSVAGSLSTLLQQQQQRAAPVVPQGYAWKLRDPVNNTTYRISTAEVPPYAQLMATTAAKVLLPGWEALSPSEGAAGSEAYPFRLVFIDDENDRVELGADEDVEECAEVFRLKAARAKAPQQEARYKVALDLSWISIEAAAFGKRATGGAAQAEKHERAERDAAELDDEADEAAETAEAAATSPRKGARANQQRVSPERTRQEVERFMEGRAERKSYLLAGSALAVGLAALFMFSKK